ncbi:hypothetical protein NX059_005224 [Plenodomus lindquistii]|nr:hypothetical protein NX059_005224 [Plenodomus lindquistii]
MYPSPAPRSYITHTHAYGAVAVSIGAREAESPWTSGARLQNVAKPVACLITQVAYGDAPVRRRMRTGRCTALQTCGPRRAAFDGLRQHAVAMNEEEVDFDVPFIQAAREFVLCEYISLVVMLLELPLRRPSDRTLDVKSGHLRLGHQSVDFLEEWEAGGSRLGGSRHVTSHFAAAER